MTGQIPVREDPGLGARILKVNPAGEHGAISFCTGPLARTGITYLQFVLRLREAL